MIMDNTPAVGAPEAMHQRLHEAERARINAAKDTLLPRAHLAVTDHEGRHISERRWRWFVRMLETL